MTDRLAGVHPELVGKVERILSAMAALGFPMMVVAGVRQVAEQQALYAKGRTVPGPVVTYKDGVKEKSNHQVRADGAGHAVDCAFLVEGKPSWDIHQPWHVYGAMAKALGLHWGGDWETLVDLPHIELR